MQRSARWLVPARWWTPPAHPVAAGHRVESGWRLAAWLVALALVFLPAVVLRDSPRRFRFLVGEDGLYEWLQVTGMAATAGYALRGVRRAGSQRRRVILAGVAIAALFVIGEELAWGTRILDVRVEGLQALNHQDDVTLHNVGLGLEASFLAMAAVSSALAGWQAARGNLALACWFAVPALYGGLRIVSGVPSYQLAKMSEVAELAFAVAAVRLVRSLVRTV
jgi:hypothetical protein